MLTRRFGPTDFTTTAIGLGGMPLSIKGRPDETAGIEVIHAALDAGMRLIDTADVYCLDHEDIGHNEALIANAVADWQVANPSAEILIATKGGLERPDGSWTRNAHPDHLKRACEASLRALGVDQIAVYQLHAPQEPLVPFEDTIGALADLQREGKVKHIGLSNVEVDHIRRARAMVEIVSVQNRCHPLDTAVFKNGVFDECAREGIAFMPYSPVGGWKDRKAIQCHSALGRVADQLDASCEEIAIGWLMHLGENVFPIPGASKIRSAQSSARAGSLDLSAHMEALSAALLPKRR